MRNNFTKHTQIATWTNGDTWVSAVQLYRKRRKLSEILPANTNKRETNTSSKTPWFLLLLTSSQDTHFLSTGAFCINLSILFASFRVCSTALILYTWIFLSEFVFRGASRKQATHRTTHPQWILNCYSWNQNSTFGCKMYYTTKTIGSSTSLLLSQPQFLQKINIVSYSPSRFCVSHLYFFKLLWCLCTFLFISQRVVNVCFCVVYLKLIRIWCRDDQQQH